MKEALIQEIKRHVNTDILYDDVYVGPFTEKDGVDCAIHAADWYRNNIWHPASEEPKDKAQCLVIADPCKLYALTDVILWADMEDLLPDMKGGES